MTFKFGVTQVKYCEGRNSVGSDFYLLSSGRNV